MKTKSAIVSLLALLLFAPSASHACSCIGVHRACEAASKSDAAFVGTVIELKKYVATDEESNREKESRETGIPRPADEWLPAYEMRISVEEAFSGVEGTEVLVYTGSGGGDCGTPIAAGTRVLLFTYKQKDKLWTGMCSGSRRIKTGNEPELVELRARKRLGSIGTIFGTVTRYKGDILEGESREVGPMKGLQVFAEGSGTRFSTKTDTSGEYEFSALPVGSYTITAALPQNLAIRQNEFSEDPTNVAKIVAGGCARIDVAAVPAGKIKGKALLSTGEPAENIKLYLLPSTVAKPESTQGKWVFTEDDGSFEIREVPAGAYILTLNYNEPPSLKSPYPTTFYPGVTKRALAETIQLDDGELKDGLVFHVSPDMTQRTITVHLLFEGKPPVSHPPQSNAYAWLEEPRLPDDVVGDGVTSADANGKVVLKGFADREYVVQADYRTGNEKEVCAEPVKIRPGKSELSVVVPLTIKTKSCMGWRRGWD